MNQYKVMIKNYKGVVVLCGVCVFLLYKIVQQQNDVLPDQKYSIEELLVPLRKWDSFQKQQQSNVKTMEGRHGNGEKTTLQSLAKNRLSETVHQQIPKEQQHPRDMGIVDKGQRDYKIQQEAVVSNNHPPGQGRVSDLDRQPQSDLDRESQSDLGRQPESDLDRQPQALESGPIPVLLLTYMRSGSSFLGEVLQISPEVFYLFEPVHAIQFAVRDNKEFSYLNKPSRKVDNFLDIASESIKGFSTCKFEDVSLKLWEDSFISGSKKASEYNRCVKEKSSANREFRSVQRECVGRVNTLCKNSSHMVMKIIRIPVNILEPMLKGMPKFKIVYLLRDPRATVKSQNKFGVVRRNFLQEDVTRYCNRVYKDVATVEEYRKKYPNRIKTVYYEDIATNPIAEYKSIYQFIGMKFTSLVENKIRDMTSSGVNKENCGALCTHKSNSSAQAHSWRKDIPMDFVKTVDNSCQPLYSKLGYLRVENEAQLRNLNHALKISVTKEDDYRYA